MTSTSEKVVTIEKPRPTQKIVDFMPEAVKAPFFLRLGAALIDYIIVIAIPVVTLLLGRFSGNDGAGLLNSEWNNAGWMIAVLLGLTNLIFLPMFSGQSLGKMITGLRIVTLDGSAPSAGTIAFRQIFGYLLTFASLGIGLFISVFSRKGRALHDYVGSTLVIYANPRIHQ